MTEKLKGFAMYETVGIASYNPRGVSKMSFVETSCPVCGEKVTDLASHAAKMNDKEHQVMEIMES